MSVNHDKEFKKICYLHHTSTKLDVEYVDKDIKGQAIVITSGDFTTAGTEIYLWKKV